MPCAPEFSYLESASAEAGSLTKPDSHTDALPSLATWHEGFFVAQQPHISVKTLSFEKRRR
ncbi:hypothetical protein SAMN05428954_2102 [Streptomyces sp. 2112.3]|nr:hypothetical protein BX261_5236 [Streptomyces sp. 2321.6]SDR19512.1 hypothetical protein SAMN05216511_2025 [Streptomyces sp. KS_16]SED60704.1 hypothetical protein SAMN05428940_5262 [Streptomyces sp. 2133.1]SEE23116.1 hypothetical protein SAMN05428954_2102 [Streptomyces sp. 2112.3]SNC71258.1 hypothetical protein SAMN06272741_5163 [Streptomyces sp. 2114.4]